MSTSLSITLILTTAAILLMAGFIVYFLYFYQKRQLQNLREQERLKSEFEQELLKAQLEIQEETLANVGRELHDNIGQTLSLARLYLGNYDTAEGKEKAHRADGLVQEAVHALRALSATLNPDPALRLSLTDAVRNLADRIADSGVMETRFEAHGEPQPLSHEVNVMLYRICQEALSNAVRHSQAQLIQVAMTWTEASLTISLQDDGKGFTPSPPLLPLPSSSPAGQGLSNQLRRAQLIGASLDLQTMPGSGTQVTIFLPIPATKTA